MFCILVLYEGLDKRNSHKKIIVQLFRQIIQLRHRPKCIAFVLNAYRQCVSTDSLGLDYLYFVSLFSLVYKSTRGSPEEETGTLKEDDVVRFVVLLTFVWWMFY